MRQIHISFRVNDGSQKLVHHKGDRSMKKLHSAPFLIFVIGLTMLAFSCGKKTASEEEMSQMEEESKMDIQRLEFGQLPDGQTVDLYVLTNGNRMEARLITYGATLVSLSVPDREGNFADVTLGFDSLDGYLAAPPYFGATVGRYANRIAKGRFTLDGIEYILATNNGENHLHGGIKGFDKVLWQAGTVRQEDGVGVKFVYLSKDGEEGYPGNLNCTVTYMLTDKDELKINYEAKTDKPTPVNLTHHSYFNLAGQGNGDILGHELMINADQYTPVDAGLIPTGEIRDVAGTPMDFTTPHTIGERIAQVEGGYDHNFVLRSGGGELALAARVHEPQYGRIMEVYTTEPGIQFYSGNFLDGSITGKGGKVYYQHYGFCLEPQHFPDSPNKPNFPSTILRPGDTYQSQTVFKFSSQ
jgi:aldose 1-epimerase